MRVLLTNHHLVNKSGSELYCLELASALLRAGHTVAIFTFQPGPVSEELARRGVTVFTVGDEARIESFDPEVLHVHHAPCLYYLGALRLRAVALCSSLGVIPALEAPPVVWEGVAQGLAVSDEVLQGLRQSRFGAAVPLQVFRNWFDDTALERPAPERPREARRIAVVSNHLDAQLREDLDALCAAHPGLTWEHFGLPHRSVEMGPAVLEGFERVVTIGRTALLAAALQKPCLLYDIHGCDGLLTVERLEQQATYNFSGRLTRARPSRQELEHLLLDEARQVDVAALAEAMWSRWSLSQRVETLVALYERLRRGPVSLGEHTRAAYGREGLVYAEGLQASMSALAHVRALERERAQQQEALEQARHRHQALEAEHAALKAEHATLGAEQQAQKARLEQALQQLAAQQQELEAERAKSQQLAEWGRQLEGRLAASTAEVERLRASLEEVEGSAAWRLVGGVRRVKDKVVAPPGSQRRQLYERLLSRLKGAS